MPRKSKDRTAPRKPRALFRVGQRVCIIRSKEAATIVSPLRLCDDVDTGLLFWGYDLCVDGAGTHYKDGTPYANEQTALRPLYDGDQTVAWSQCAWQPKPETKQKRKTAAKQEHRADD